MDKFRTILVKVTKVVTLGAIPLVLMFLGAFVTMWLTIRGHEVMVPNVVGVERPQAEAALSRERLKAVVAGTRFSADFPKGQVLLQVPEAGTRVKVDKTIKLYLSEGKKQVTVPRLTGLTLKEAQIVLEQSGLRPGMISRAGVMDSSRETVLEQFPAAGATDLKTPYVNLLVNQPGAETAYVMPDLHGLNARDVAFFLEKNGFILRPMEYEPSFVSEPGTILSHYPQPGYPVTRNTPVTLVVSR